MIMRENTGLLCRGSRELVRNTWKGVVSTGLGQAESQAAMPGVTEAADHWTPWESVPEYKLIRHVFKRMHSAKNNTLGEGESEIGQVASDWPELGLEPRKRRVRASEERPEG